MPPPIQTSSHLRRVEDPGRGRMKRRPATGIPAGHRHTRRAPAPLKRPLHGAAASSAAVAFFWRLRPPAAPASFLGSSRPAALINLVSSVIFCA